MKYKSVIVTKRGGPEALQVIENELCPPSAGQVRIRILATPVVRDDVAVRIGNRPFLAKIPFVPGYSVAGVVDATGAGVSGFTVGDHVAALTNFGGYAEYICWEATKVVPVPAKLDPAAVVVLILNYLVAYQCLHRLAKVKQGDTILLIGASGGVGTAFLELGKLANLTMYGLASAAKHQILAAYGATPIDYHHEDFVEVMRQAEPGGIDFVFNGMGDEYIERALAVLKRGGALIHYGAPESLTQLLLLVGKIVWYNILPNGKTLYGYGTHRGDVESFKEDWRILFTLLAEGRIAPIIAAKFPLLAAAKANELLESGQVIGNVVLVAPELLLEVGSTVAGNLAMQDVDKLMIQN